MKRPVTLFTGQWADLALNDIEYYGPLSVEWEDSGMDRETGAIESCEFVRKTDFVPGNISFDSAFSKE